MIVCGYTKYVGAQNRLNTGKYRHNIKLGTYKNKHVCIQIRGQTPEKHCPKIHNKRTYMDTNMQVQDENVHDMGV